MRAVLVASAVFAPGSAAAAPCTWVSEALPLPADTRFSAITGAADDGSHVLGVGASGWDDVALVWHNGSVRSVPLGPGQFPNDVNASGIVLVNTVEGRAFRGDTELNPLPGANSAWAAAINSEGAGAANPVGVEWDLRGTVVRPLTGSADATDVTSSGDVLGLTPGAAGVWRANGEVEQPPAMNTYQEFADTGSLYGAFYDEGTYTPVQVRCA